MTLHRDNIKGALARGYCRSDNQCKRIDNDLIEAMSDELMQLIDAYLVAHQVEPTPYGSTRWR